MNTPAPEKLQIAGLGHAFIKIPLRLRLARFLAAFGTSFFLFISGLNLIGWDWLLAGFNNKLAVSLAFTTTISILSFGWLLTSRRAGSLWNLRPAEKPERGWRYGGQAGISGVLASIGFIFVPTIASLFLLQRLASENPLPKKLVFEELTTKSGETTLNGLRPIYFWDYATVYDPNWFNDYEIVLPYEKGPPEKLLGSFLFQHRKTRALAAAFFGKRPRSYDRVNTENLFLNPTAALHPKTWPTIYQLTREAGASGASTLSLLRSPRSDRIGTQERFFFWSPSGDVFQIRCDAPCPFAIAFSEAQFAQDPRASLSERKALTRRRLKQLLETMPKSAAERQLHESELMLNLISWLTLDPRDPEALFHIGKLASNRESVASAIRYGKDLKMTAPQVAELETRLASFEY